MNTMKDRGEKLASAMTNLVQAFERWDYRQFRFQADAEWSDFYFRLQTLNMAVTDKILLDRAPKE